MRVPTSQRASSPAEPSKQTLASQGQSETMGVLQAPMCIQREPTENIRYLYVEQKNGTRDTCIVIETERNGTPNHGNGLETGESSAAS